MLGFAIRVVLGLGDGAGGGKEVAVGGGEAGGELKQLYAWLSKDMRIYQVRGSV